MKTKLFALFTGLAVLFFSAPGIAAGTNDVRADLNDLVTRINTKLRANQRAESDLAGELKEFDALLVKHKGADAEDLSKVLAMKAGLYLQVLDQPEKAAATFLELKKEFPKTEVGQQVDAVLSMIAQQAEVKKIQDSLVVGKAFPDFNEMDLTGKPLSVANFKGKVVLVDFWATWCGPCVAELPNVLKVFKKHHQNGFEIIGVSLDEQKARLESFIKDKGMTWPQYFDGNKWSNKLAVKYGVTGIPATFLLDREGNILGKDLRGDDLEKAVAAALAKK